MKDNTKKVLKYVIVGFLSFLVGASSVIGLSMCSANNVKKSSADSSSATYTLKLKDNIDANSLSIPLSDWNLPQNNGSIGQDIIDANGSAYFSVSLVFQEREKMYLTEVKLYHPSSSLTLYDGDVQNTDAFQGTFETLIFELSTGTDVYYQDFTSIFWSLFEHVNTASTFTFNQQINYYAPYGSNIDNYFVTDSTMVNSGDYSLKVLMDNVWFRSGGELFNKIQLRYINAIAQTYKSGSLYHVMNVNGNASYMWMEYINTSTNALKIVNTRQLEMVNQNDVISYAQTMTSNWESPNYMKIELIFGGDDVLNTKLNSLNNANVVGTYFTNYNTDIGLQNVFVLFSMAFASILPLLSIQLIPGVTIGLLMFMPLIVGIILLVLWLVKR